MGRGRRCGAVKCAIESRVIFESVASPVCAERGSDSYDDAVQQRDQQLDAVEHAVGV
jgi:hypothetical protein